LYGSRARGSHQPDSDVDLAVLLPGARRPRLPVALEMTDATYDTLLATGMDISPLPIWQDEWQNPHTYRNPELLRTIAQEGIRV